MPDPAGLDELLLAQDALGLAGLLGTGQLDPKDLLEAVIRRTEAVNPTLNAITLRLYDEAHRQLRSGTPPGPPFHGLPFLLKDLIATQPGIPTSSGSRFLRNVPRPLESELVRRYRRAGLLIFGRTSTPEYGLSPVTEPEAFGPCRNPWAPSRSPGGSSGGAAAMVAARVLPMAHGGDGAGSIRIPASCCGLFGLKPSRGRNPTGPEETEHWQGLAVEHALTLSVRDSAALLDVSAGYEPGAPYDAPKPVGGFLGQLAKPPGRLRIAVCREPLLATTALHPDCLEALDATVGLLEDLGHDLDEIHSPLGNPQPVAEAFLTVTCGILAAEIDLAQELTGRRAGPVDHETLTWIIKRLGEGFRASQHSRAWLFLQSRARLAARKLFENHEALLTPTLGQPPPEVGSLQPRGFERWLTELVGRRLQAPRLMRRRIMQGIIDQMSPLVPNTPLFNLTGGPAMSVPLHWSRQGLPIGLQFAADYGREDLLLRLAAQLEEARPWRHRLPPVHA